MFLFKQLAAGFAERLLSQLPHLDPSFSPRLMPLVGKRLTVVITDLSFSLSLVATESGLKALTPEVSTEVDVAIECVLTTKLSALGELRDPSNITKLIKSNQLDLVGDIHIAQGFGQLFKETQIDWEEHLSKVVGDGMAHRVASRLNAVIAFLSSLVSKTSMTTAELVQDELNVTPHRLAFEAFAESVQQTQADIDKLAVRINRLIKE